MHRRSRTGKIVDLIHALLKLKRMDYIVGDESEIIIFQKMLYVLSSSSEEIVHTDHFVSFLDKIFAKMASNKSCSSCD